MGERPERTRFGWQGIELDVPRGWDLQAYNGDRRRGYAALDDSLELRLHVRWVERAGARADPEAAVRQYERSLRKKSKGRVVFKQLTPEFLPMRSRKEKLVAPFHWEGDQSAYGYAWCCLDCRRAGLVEVLFPRTESDRSLARGVLGSLTDHRDDGRQLWAVYDFAFWVPAPYNLKSTTLNPGQLRFGFEGPQRGQLTVERWSMASALLGKMPLDKWPREVLHRERQGDVGRFEQEAVHVQGLEAWRFTQHVAGRGLRRGFRREGVLWHDGQADKICAVVAREAPDGLVDSVAAGASWT